MSAQLGAKTLLVERDKLGGDCTWTGCIPSKALLKAAKVREHVATAARYGLEPAELRVDLAKVLGRVHEIQERVYEEADRPEVIAAFGVEVRTGEARFTGPHAIELATSDGKPPTRVRFRRAVIASGSAPRVPEIDGPEAGAFLTNETIFRLTVLPAHLIVLGGGPIGVEMAQAFRRLGSRVTVLQRNDAILPKDDRELAALLRGRLEAEGVRVLCGVKVTRVERAARAGKERPGDDAAVTAAPVRVTFEHEGAASTLDADAILVATGRAARIASLGLDAAGVHAQEHGITIDARCRTRQRHIYACGDVTGELQFTHMAEHMAKVAITNAIIGLPSKIDRAGVPWVTFTDPELAHVGARRADLDRAGTRYRVYRFPFTKIDRAVAERATEGWVHVLTTPHTGRILGATILGEGAGEMIAELALARNTASRCARSPTRFTPTRPSRSGTVAPPTSATCRARRRSWCASFASCTGSTARSRRRPPIASASSEETSPNGEARRRSPVVLAETEKVPAGGERARVEAACRQDAHVGHAGHGGLRRSGAGRELPRLIPLVGTRAHHAPVYLQYTRMAGPGDDRPRRTGARQRGRDRPCGPPVAVPELPERVVTPAHRLPASDNRARVVHADGERRDALDPRDRRERVRRFSRAHVWSFPRTTPATSSRSEIGRGAARRCLCPST